MLTAAAREAGGRRAMARLDTLARFSDGPQGLTRLYLSSAHVAAAARVGTWMEDAGMAVHLDAVGNIVGRFDGTDAGAPAVLIGSHIDTVRNAGHYDGALGVIVAIEAVAALQEEGERLPFPIEIIAFGDEEGVRFPVTLTGSKAVSGTLDQRSLEAADEDGITVREALRTFGCPADLATVARRREDVRAYLEVHIEQGPVLEQAGLPVGIVTAIAGATRATVTVSGTAGHAGTVPMSLRHDAGAAAAEMILAVERIGLDTDNLVATVGRVHVHPGAVNVIPAQADFTIDMRSPFDTLRKKSLENLRKHFREIAERRHVSFIMDVTYDQSAALCDGQLVELWVRAVRDMGLRSFQLASGAGHDGLAMAALCPIGMLFVRCRGGISHNPAESVIEGDVDVSIRVLADVLRKMSVAKSTSLSRARAS